MCVSVLKEAHLRRPIVCRCVCVVRESQVADICITASGGREPRDYPCFLIGVVSTDEYSSRKYPGAKGFCACMIGFFAIIDILSVAPYWCMPFFVRSSGFTTFVRALRLLRFFQSERYVKALRVFDDVLYAQAVILIITGFAALIFTIILSVVMYLLERDNPDPSTAIYYKIILDAMWITLLILSGSARSPSILCWARSLPP